MRKESEKNTERGKAGKRGETNWWDSVRIQMGDHEHLILS